MSANLDLVRSIYADWERGDYSRTEWADPEIEFAIADGPDPSQWIGVAGMAEGWRGRLSRWKGHRSVAEEFREIDSARVLVLANISGRGKTSGVETHRHGATVFTLRSGKVTRLIGYWDRDRALADLGLAPEGDI